MPLTTEQKRAALAEAYGKACDYIEGLEAELAKAPRWFTLADPPTKPGIYYWEHGDERGYPHPGFYLWEEGKPANLPSGMAWKLFGPIPGAMQKWEPAKPMTSEQVSEFVTETLNDLCSEKDSP